MAGSIALPSVPGDPIPEDIIDLLVSVDSARCAPGSKLAVTDNTWIQASLFEIVVSGTLHFAGTPVHRIAGETTKQFLQRRVWQELSSFDPSARTEGERRRLTFPVIQNQREKARLAELLGDAIGT